MNTAIASKPRILTDNPHNAHCSDWQAAIRDVITSAEELLTEVGLGDEWLPAAKSAAECFPIRVPRGYANRIQRGNPNDPLLRQVLPLQDELQQTEGFSDDAVGDLASLKAKGLLQKYHGRALLITTAACGVHCRFCFRRAFPYEEQTASRSAWSESVRLLADDDSISEVILSGGDPLSLSDTKLSELITALDAIPHIRRIRIHTRQPIVLPERITASLTELLSTRRAQVIVVLHCNHSQELNNETLSAFNALRSSGATLLNQAVLLKDVNDTPEALIKLSERLFSQGVLPYYLHLLDRVTGTAHFEVKETKAQQLMRNIAAELPGYLVPKLVKEEMGKMNKTNVLW